LVKALGPESARDRLQAPERVDGRKAFRGEHQDDNQAGNISLLLTTPMKYRNSAVAVVLLMLIGSASSLAAQAQPAAAPQPAAVVIPPNTPEIILWPAGAPGSEARRNEPVEISGETMLNVHNPSIYVFQAPSDKATGVGLILAPGGGHTSLWIMHEGFNAAQALAEKGITTFVLKNRLQSSGYKFDVEGLADIARAIRLVRSRAAEWGLEPDKIGAGGFSAGGELAGLVADRNDPGVPAAVDPIERVSSRPDFQVLVYPGKSRQVIQPTPQSPPAFLAAGFGDREDISVGLAEAYLRFKRAGVMAELHMYGNTGHGFGIRPERGPQAHQEWTTQLLAFLTQFPQGRFIARPTVPSGSGAMPTPARP
jgi:endo-1,4-beta-xylanase